MRPPPKARHVPSATSDDVGAEMRERAAESCGFHQGQHLSDSLAELERNGGPEQVVTNAAKRIERGAR